MEARPFVIDVPQTALDDLTERLGRTRWPDEVEGAGWDYGTSLPYLQEVVERRLRDVDEEGPHLHRDC